MKSDDEISREITILNQAARALKMMFRIGYSDVEHAWLENVFRQGSEEDMRIQICCLSHLMLGYETEQVYLAVHRCEDGCRRLFVHDDKSTPAAKSVWERIFERVSVVES
ncbi:MAG: hypothetical protein PHC51_07905 [bacterium]|nr:hypothetical protein [bacterium]